MLTMNQLQSGLLRGDRYLDEFDDEVRKACAQGMREGMREAWPHSIGCVAART
jgi:hypothetical protein